MTEKEPNDTASGTSRRQDSDLPHAIGRFFYEHPAIAVSLLYLQVTTVGVVYSWALFKRFDINIFDYAETNDFLLAAFKDPVVFMMTFATFLGYIVTPLFSGIRRGVRARRLEEEQEQLQVSSGEEVTKMPSRGLSVDPLGFSSVLVGIVVILAYTLILPYWFANLAADELLGPKYKPFTSVQYRATSNSDEQTRKTGLRVIGTTQSFVFFYDREDTQTLVIPTAQIVEMEHDGPKGEAKEDR